MLLKQRMEMLKKRRDAAGTTKAKKTKVNGA